MIASAMKERAGLSDCFVADASKGVLVLLVEDEQMDREIIADRLSRMNVVVHQAVSRKQAIGLSDHNHYDLALVDMHLPWEGNGIAVMKALRSRNPMIPICAYSGAISAGNVERISAEVGCVAIADKMALFRNDNYLVQLFTLCGLARRAGMEYEMAY